MNVSAYKLPPTFREADLLPLPREFASTALILLFREEVFSSRRPAEWPAVIDRRYRAGSNEVEAGKYFGSRPPRIHRHASSLPPSPLSSCGTPVRRPPE